MLDCSFQGGEVSERLRRHFDEVKQRAGAFVEGATTALAVKDGIAQISRALPLGDLSRVAMRTVHETRAADLAQRDARIPSGQRTYNSGEPVLTVSNGRDRKTASYLFTRT